MNSHSNPVLNVLRDKSLWDEDASDGSPATLGLMADRQYASCVEEPTAIQYFTREQIDHAAPILDRIRNAYA